MKLDMLLDAVWKFDSFCHASSDTGPHFSERHTFQALNQIRKTKTPIPKQKKKNLCIHTWLTFDVCVLRLDSVANPFPQIVQWKGRFLALSTWASWLRRCCCRLDSWMKALPQSGKWHLYGLSPTRKEQSKEVTILGIFRLFGDILGPEMSP